MDIQIHAKQMDLTEALRSYVEDKFGKTNKFFNRNVTAEVHLNVEGHRHSVHAELRGAGKNLNSQAEDPVSMYKAIDMCVDKVEKQLRRGKHDRRQDTGKFEMRTNLNLGVEVEEA